MNRDTRVVVTRIASRFDVLLTVPLVNPKLYFTLTPYTADGEAPVFLCDIRGNEVIATDPAPGKRPYFIVKSDNASDIVAATRLIDVPVVENFRDQGGYLTASGQIVKWGRFFRGGAFTRLDNSDRAYLDTLGLRLILDYRDDSERAAQPDYIPDGATAQIIPAIRRTAEEIEEFNRTAVYSMEERLQQMCEPGVADEEYEKFKDIYRSLPFTNPAYQGMFDSLDCEETAHIYQHCSAGKDRTGVGCAML
ncbi:tyrosine-protein phosphatase, partial [Ruminococcaceae bacterium OttesenSCG-928-L11]|nr:tyrosine-protein phosphatase [Ruminococcaceae bacterium OttesenSCG-928-L11]